MENFGKLGPFEPLQSLWNWGRGTLSINKRSESATTMQTPLSLVQGLLLVPSTLDLTRMSQFKDLCLIQDSGIHSSIVQQIFIELLLKISWLNALIVLGKLHH